MSKTTKSGIIPHLAKLANLPLTSQEVTFLEPQITSILESVKQVQGLELKNVQATNQVTNKTNEYRDDMVLPSLTQDQALSGAKQTYKGFFVVPAVIDQNAV